ncbi:unnamed protein product, partial [marine sediment metagenome]
MSHTAGLPLKFQKEIQQYRAVYQNKNLRYVRNNQVFYWRFLSHLEDIGYRPRTVERYHVQLKMFLNWLGAASVRRVRKEQVEQYLLWFKNERQREAYTLRYVRQTLSVFFSFVMRYSRMTRNPAAGLRIRTHFPQPERIDVFSQPEVLMIVRKALQERGRLRRSNFPTEYSYCNAFYTLTMQYLMVKLMFSTGIRPCELVNVEV